MNLAYFQKGFNYAQDGPGNRLVYHLQGCNLLCPWCSNPEGMGSRCAQTKIEPVEQVARAILSARPMFFDGGGLTLTGGEVTVQLEAVLELAKRVREGGVSVAVETNATREGFSRLLPLLDVVIADFKHPDSEKHREKCGQGNETVKKNLRLAAESGKPCFFRVPLIHHFNDDDEALGGFTEFFSEFRGRENVSIEVLRYHEYGKDKWAQCGKEYTMRDAFVDPERAKLFEETWKAQGLHVIRT